MYSCDHCGKLFISDYRPALGHDWVLKDKTPASCLAIGFEEWECSVCHIVEVRNTVDATGHSGVLLTLEHDAAEIAAAKAQFDYLKDPIASTCAAVGYELYKCSECGLYYNKTTEIREHNGILLQYVYDSENALVADNETNLEIAAALAADSTLHAPLAPTCTSTGWALYRCSYDNCGVYYNVKLEKLPHNWIEVERKAPTCQAINWDDNGNPTGWAEPTYGNKPGEKCKDCGTIHYGCEVIEPHNWQLVTTIRAATCTQDGEARYSCTICGMTKETFIPRLDHYDNNKDEICDGCKVMMFNTMVDSSMFEEIKTLDDLRNIANNPYGYYWLKNDLTLTSGSNNWTQLFDENKPFRGIFYGGGHTIKALKFDLTETAPTDTREASLFGYNSSVIAMLNIEGITIKSTDANVRVGGFATVNNGRIISCKVKGAVNIEISVHKEVTAPNVKEVHARTAVIGVLVGENYGKLVNCIVDSKPNVFVSTVGEINVSGVLEFLLRLIRGTEVTVESTVSLGTLAGINRGSGEIRDCSAVGAASVSVLTYTDFLVKRGKAFAYSYLYMGSYVGQNYGRIEDCVAAEMSVDMYGGLSGSHEDYGLLHTQVYQTNNYSATQGVKGLIGFNAGQLIVPAA